VDMIDAWAVVSCPRLTTRVARVAPNPARTLEGGWQQDWPAVS